VDSVVRVNKAYTVLVLFYIFILSLLLVQNFTPNVTPNVTPNFGEADGTLVYIGEFYGKCTCL